MPDNEFLWVEKYRPKTIEECVLPPELKKLFLGIVKSGDIQNLLLTGTAGLGKTTVALALCEELGLEHIVINGSEESGIDVLRNRIRQFASSVSLSSEGPKVVILDEADYLNPQSTQPALRGFIEEFSSNCRFILTCNFKNRIIAPLIHGVASLNLTPASLSWWKCVRLSIAAWLRS
jgi:DNA polymerase III delta prime subunit